MRCRHCGAELQLNLLDLGAAPPSNGYLTEQALHSAETWFPLRVLVCEQCWLAQTEDVVTPQDLFDAEYAYFSGFSSSWLSHCEAFVADMVERFALTARSHVVEIAANDGYLLQYVKARHIPCTGVEPTASTAATARAKGIVIVEDFFGVDLARTLAARDGQADLTVANNVLAHVPDINNFVAGFPILLKPQGVSTFEFPHLQRLLAENQFDTIYHEHYSYLSLTAVDRIFASNGLRVFDVEELSTHGGSLRVYAQRSDTGSQSRSPRVDAQLRREIQAGMQAADCYADFQGRADKVKDDFLIFLIQAKRSRKTVAAYGAAAKGNTLMNYAGIRHDLIAYVVDRNPAKQGKYMPGSRIPIVDEGWLSQTRPDYVVLLPWNLTRELTQQLAYVRDWGGQFVTAVPELRVLS